MSNTIPVIQGTSLNLAVDLVYPSGNQLHMHELVGAQASFTLRTTPTSMTNVILWTTVANPLSLAFQQYAPVLDLTFQPTDTSSLAVGSYFYQLQVTLASGDVIDAIPWAPFYITLGGSASPAPPALTNTVVINENYQIPGALLYVTPGGSPICGVQIRLYYKSDYQCGNLSSPVGVTTTNAYGGFTNSLLVTTGYSYILRWEDPGRWGPNTAEVVA
jgi:hypothetical protein